MFMHVHIASVIYFISFFGRIFFLLPTYMSLEGQTLNRQTAKLYAQAVVQEGSGWLQLGTAARDMAYFRPDGMRG